MLDDVRTFDGMLSQEQIHRTPSHTTPAYLNHVDETELQLWCMGNGRCYNYRMGMGKGCNAAGDDVQPII